MPKCNRHTPLCVRLLLLVPDRSCTQRPARHQCPRQGAGCAVGATDLSEHMSRTYLLSFRPNPTAPTPRTLPGIDGLSEQGSGTVAGPADLPEHVIVAMLKRENLLTRAKLNALFYDHITGERQLRKLKTELRQVSNPG